MSRPILLLVLVCLVATVVSRDKPSLPAKWYASVQIKGDVEHEAQGISAIWVDNTNSASPR